MSGSDWTQVKGRPTGSLDLSPTAAYSLGDPQMTAMIKSSNKLHYFESQEDFMT